MAMMFRRLSGGKQIQDALNGLISLVCTVAYYTDEDKF